MITRRELLQATAAAAAAAATHVPASAQTATDAYDMFQRVNKEFATSNYHWFFLIQPAPLPETLIGNSVDFFLRGRFANLIPQGITPEAYAEYFRCFSNPQTIHATCEDYRAGASIDLEHDEADRAKKIACPMMALWSERGNTGRTFDVKATWQARAAMPVSGKALPGGHFLPEETTDRRSRNYRRS